MEKTSLNRLTALLLPLLVLVSSSAYSQTFPDPVPGWTHPRPFRQDTPEQYGVVLSGLEVSYSSPAIADLDGDPSNGLEVVIGGSDGIVYAYHADGRLLWTVKTPNATCRKGGRNNRLHSSPAIGDLYGNGNQYVVIGYGGVGMSGCDGGVMAIRGRDGKRAWTFSLRKLSKRAKFWAINHAVFGTPALADTDGDGRMEIGFGSFDRNVYLLNANGSLRWYYIAGDTVWSSPSFANVDGDPELEMIIGTDISQNQAAGTENGGYVYAFDTGGRSPPKLGFRQADAFVWSTYIDQVVQSSPVVAELIGSNDGREIAVGTGCFFPEGSRRKSGQALYVLSLRTGAILKRLDSPGCFTSSPAVGDVDGDGENEIVASVNGAQSVGGDGKSRLVAWKPSRSQPLWISVPSERGRNDAWGGHFISPILADLDGNGSIEVALSNSSSVSIFSGHDGRQLTCGEDPCASSELWMYAWRGLRSTPSVGDLNGDGQLDLVVGGSHDFKSYHGLLYAWTGFAGRLGSDPGPNAPWSAPWSTHRGGADRSGLSKADQSPPRSIATITPRPTEPPLPTATATSTRTPRATPTERPTQTPRPTRAPRATRTPRPTATVAPRPTRRPRRTPRPRPPQISPPTIAPPTATPTPGRSSTPRPSPTPFDPSMPGFRPR